MINFLKKLFPLNRSLTGNGVRETLSLIKNEIGQLEIKEIPSGTRVFDWMIPEEWECNAAYIEQPNGTRICEFSVNNLYLMGYSEAIDKIVNLKDLQKHLHSLPDMPTAIPYVTSYYNRSWGFCIEHQKREKLKNGEYRVFIDSSFKKGHLSYGELYIPSTSNSEEEVFLSTYVCHPSMANNELSGPVVVTYLSKWLLGLKERKYNYRIIFIPETIGSIAYLSLNLEKMKKKVIAGYNVTCVGDERCFSFLPSRQGNTLSDKIALNILDQEVGEYKKYTFLERGSDERQYCSPGVDLPIATICRSKYHEYPEYHTSKDDLTLVTNKGLNGSLSVYKKVLTGIEKNGIYKNTILCEPFMSSYNLYPKTGTRDGAVSVKYLMDIMAYCDGKNSLIEIAEILEVSILKILSEVDVLINNKLIKKIK